MDGDRSQLQRSRSAVGDWRTEDGELCLIIDGIIGFQQGDWGGERASYDVVFPPKPAELKKFSLVWGTNEREVGGSGCDCDWKTTALGRLPSWELF